MKYFCSCEFIAVNVGDVCISIHQRGGGGSFKLENK